MAALNVRIPEELNNALIISAKELDRTKGYIVRKALEAYLQELQEDIKDAEIALATKNDKNMKCYTSEEVRAYIKANCHD